MRSLRSLLGLAPLLAGVLASCAPPDKLPAPEPVSDFHVSSLARQPSSEELARVGCEQAIRDTLAESGMPGAPVLEANRVAILTATKAEPVVFVDVPKYDDQEVPAPVVRYRKQLTQTQYPVDVLHRLLPIFESAPKIGRQTLLKNGYLYAEDAKLANALVNLVRVEHLFGHDRIWIRRGDEVSFAERKKGRYYYVDGPNAGDRVTLLLFDQLGYGPVPTQSLVRDLRALRATEHFDRVRVRHLTDSHMVVDLRYGQVWVPSLLRSTGAHLELQCDVQGASVSRSVQAAKASSKERYDVVQRMRRVMLDQIDEQLPFDEPRREWGMQLDGRLRQNWRHAYLNGQRTFAFNGDRYRVFDEQGRPLVPQVCVDFLTDTFERTSGTWWRGKAEPPGRDIGKLDYDPTNVVARSELRRVPNFVEYARSHPEQFEVLDIDPSQRIEMGDSEHFFDYLQREQAEYQPGDVVVIRGPTPWDRTQQHYHSFFIYESDPITGLPIALVGNAGRPSVRYWSVETRRTPERAIWHRLRPTTPWLQAIADPNPAPAPVVAPLSPRGNAG